MSRTVTLPESWVLVRPCGCFQGSSIAVGRDGTIYTATAEAAFKDFYPTQRARDKATREGFVCRAITDEEWDNFMQLFTTQCTHEATK